MYEEYLRVIDDKFEELNMLSDGIWECAETAFSEFKSVKLLTDFLKKEGFTVNSPAFGIDTAFSASFGSGKPVIGFLGEFDALAGLSQKADVFEKTEYIHGGNGHGCGHNLLGAGALAAALAVKSYLEAGNEGTVIYFGCPGEEGGSGKAFMAREGAFSDLDLALTWHPGDCNMVMQYTSLANIQILYRFYGKAAHAAGNPEDGRSALDAVELMNVGCNFLREHMPSDCRIHYAIIDSGGFSPNVVQPYASVLYLIRAPKVGDVQELADRVTKIAEGMAIATGTRFEKDIIKSCANVIPNTVLEEELYRSFTEVEKPEYTREDYEYAAKITAADGSNKRGKFDALVASLDNPDNVSAIEGHGYDPLYDFVIPYEKKLHPPVMKGSTDVGDVSWQCPTAQISTSTWAPLSGGHSWQIVAQGKGDIAHKATAYCGKILADTAIRLYNDAETVERAKEEYRKRLEGQSYVPIPKDVHPRPIDSLK